MGKGTSGASFGRCGKFLPEVEHWRRAVRDGWFVHLAVEVPVKDGSNVWLESVDEEYGGRLK